MQNQDGQVVEPKTETKILPTSKFDDWLKFQGPEVVEPTTDPTILPNSKLDDWLNFRDREVVEPKTETKILPTSKVDDWLRFQGPKVVEPKNIPTILINSELNDWLNFEDEKVKPKTETTTLPPPETNDWLNYRDDEVMQQHSAIQAEEAGKIAFVGDKEPLSSLADEYKSGNPILLEKIKVLTEQYAAIRRARGDGNCFFRSFMFAYLEHILESQDRAEVDRITVNVEQCRKTLLSLGYAELTFEDFFELFLEQLQSVLSGKEEDSISHEELLHRCRDQSISDFVVMFFRFITSGEIKKRSEFYEPFIQGLTSTSVEQFCKSSVEPMGEESDHVHITALSDALGVAIRVVYLDRSHDDKGSVSVNHHDFTPEANSSGGEATTKPFITLLYRPGHYDILYPK